MLMHRLVCTFDVGMQQIKVFFHPIKNKTGCDTQKDNLNEVVLLSTHNKPKYEFNSSFYLFHIDFRR